MSGSIGAGVFCNHDRFDVGAFLRKFGAQILPDLFGNEGHKGMQQPQRAFENVGQGRKRRRAIGRPEPELGHFDVPIAVIVPEEVIELLLSVT